MVARELKFTKFSVGSCHCLMWVWREVRAAHQNVLFSSSIIKVIGGTAVAAKPQALYFPAPSWSQLRLWGWVLSSAVWEKWHWPHHGEASFSCPCSRAFPWLESQIPEPPSEGRCYTRQVQGQSESLNNHVEEEMPIDPEYSTWTVSEKEISVCLKHPSILGHLVATAVYPYLICGAHTYLLS